jgi:glycosidase
MARQNHGAPESRRARIKGGALMQRRVASRAVNVLICLAAITIANTPIAFATETPMSGWRAERDVFYLVFVRSFADSNGDHIGDFHGIEQRLQYLRDLGVTSIILTPIVPSTTYHNYFTSRFDAVDPAYGNLAAFQHLVMATHRRHMKIYLDEEIQYVEWGHLWWTESTGNPASRFSGYILYKNGSDSQPEQGFLEGATSVGYDGRAARIAVVNLDSPAVQAYFAGLFTWWLDPYRDGRFTAGVDGFRIDHMMDDLDHMGRLRHLDENFWAPLFARSRAVNPAISIIAEQADWQYGDDLLKHGDVDIVYAFPLRKAIVTLDRDTIAREIEATQAHTPPGKGQLIFIENHDTDRFASLVEGDPRKERIGAALTVLLKGSPLIYYGQELGMKGRQLHGTSSDGNDIPVREAMRWARRIEDAGGATWYRGKELWWTDRYARDDDGISVEDQQGREGSLLEYYRQLLTLRRSHVELQQGEQRVLSADAPGLLVVSRTLGTHQSLLVVNCSAAAVSAHIADSDLPGLHGRTHPKDLLAVSGTATPGADGLVITIDPFGVRLLELR